MNVTHPLLAQIFLFLQRNLIELITFSDHGLDRLVQPIAVQFIIVRAKAINTVKKWLI